MNRFVILTDSTSDMNRTLREQYNVDYVAMNYLIGDEEFEASLDWEYHTPNVFYDIMRNGTRITTTQVPQTAFAERFNAYLEQGCDVIYLACSSALSASVNTARVVAKEVLADYPERHIACIDTLISGQGQMHLVIEAALWRDAGKSFEDTVAHIEDIKLCVNQCGTVGSLEYLRRAGRVTASSAFFGNLFGVKPLIISDRIGQNFAIKKVKGASAARAAIAQMIKDGADGHYDTLYLSHADCEDDVLALRDAILDIAPFETVHIDTIRPIVGASVGPGTVIAYCFGKEVTIEGKE